MNEKTCIEDLVRIESVWSRILRDHTRFRVAPQPGIWSPAEDALHVVLSLEDVARAFARLSGTENRAAPPQRGLRVDLGRRFVLGTFRLPEVFVTPEAWRPRVLLPPAELTERLRDARTAFVPLLDLASVSRRELWHEHKELGPMSFAEWVRYLHVHSLHHARRARKSS